MVDRQASSFYIDRVANPLSDSDGFTFIEALVVVALLIMVGGGVYAWQNRPPKASSPSEANKSASASSTQPSTPRISTTPGFLISRDHHVYSISLDGKHEHPVTSLDPVANAYAESGVLIASPNHQYVALTKDNQVYRINSDGSNQIQITHYNPQYFAVPADYHGDIGPGFGIVIVGISDDGNTILYSTSFNPSSGAPANGLFAYTVKSGTTTKIDDQVGSIDGRVKVNQFAGFVHNQPLFIQTGTDLLLTLDAESGVFTPVSSHPIAYLSDDHDFLDLDHQILIYNPHGSEGHYNSVTGKTLTQSLSYIAEVDLSTGTSKQISPTGSFAEYQYLAVSPNFRWVIYGHQALIDGLSSATYYRYDRQTGETKELLWGKALTFITWLDNDTAIYQVQGASVASPGPTLKCSVSLMSCTTFLSSGAILGYF